MDSAAETVLIVLAIVIPIYCLMAFIVVAIMVARKRTHENKERITKVKEPTRKETKSIGDIPVKDTNELNRKNRNALINYFKLIWKTLEEIIRFEKEQKNYISNNIGNYKAYLTNEALKKIDISKINRNGSRIPVQALKNAGIKNIAGLLKYDGNFQRIYGVGQISERNISNNLTSILIEVKKNIKIKLSYNNRGAESTNLVHPIAILLSANPTIQKARKLLDHRISINNLLKDLKKTTNTFAMTFHKEETLQKSKEIVEEIILIFNNNFANFQKDIIDPFNQAKSKTKEEAWSDFKKDPIPFNKMIERLSSGATVSAVLGEYNLTADIASKVKNTPLNIDGLKLELRQYQEWGSKYIICQGKTIIGDEMGLGKTIEAIAAMVHLANNGATHFMVICPLSVLTNWCREVERFSSLTYYRIYQDYRNTLFKKWIDKGGVAITTYESLDNLPIDSEYNVDLLVVDEAHLIKNPQTIRSMNTRKVMIRSSRITLLTGTVLENKVDEMVRLVRYLNPEVASQIDPLGFGGDIELFREKVGMVYFRRKRSDVLSELPEKTEIEDWCDLNEVEFNKYKESIYLHEFQQARRVSWNVDAKQSTKMQKLRTILEQAKEDGRKVLVFSFFLDTLASIKNEFRDIAYGPIDGSVSTNKRQDIIDSFNTAPDGSLLICQIQSGGIGLNIQAASVVVICEPQFKPSTENQAISRSYRMGQAFNVLVYRLLATDTVDERLMDILHTKQITFNNYADDSSIADQSFKIDSSIFSGIIDREYERIFGNGNTPKIEIKKEEPLPVRPLSSIQFNRRESPKQPSSIDTFEPEFIESPNGGVSVTQRIKMVSQPRGGYINPKEFEITQLETKDTLGEENVSPGLVGLVVDYLTRFSSGTSKEEAFKISLLGAELIGEERNASLLLSYINGLDEKSIISAIKLTGYDVVFRAGPMGYKPIEEIKPDLSTINNIKIMVERSLNFFKLYGPVTKDGFTFEGGYTETISSGDGDFLTSDTLWDFKVSKKSITSAHTLQLLIYYLMGIHSIHPEFKDIKYLGVYNPRLNMVFKYDLSNLAETTKDMVEQYVIGYK